MARFASDAELRTPAPNAVDVRRVSALELSLFGRPVVAVVTRAGVLDEPDICLLGRRLTSSFFPLQQKIAKGSDDAEHCP